MKKTYIAPSIMLREVELADIIATSLGVNDETSGQSLLGRENRPSIWD